MPGMDMWVVSTCKPVRHCLAELQRHSLECLCSDSRNLCLSCTEAGTCIVNSPTRTRAGSFRNTSTMADYISGICDHALSSTRTPPEYPLLVILVLGGDGVSSFGGPMRGIPGPPGQF